LGLLLPGRLGLWLGLLLGLELLLDLVLVHATVISSLVVSVFADEHPVTKAFALAFAFISVLAFALALLTILTLEAFASHVAWRAAPASVLVIVPVVVAASLALVIIAFALSFAFAAVTTAVAAHSAVILLESLLLHVGVLPRCALAVDPLTIERVVGRPGQNFLHGFFVRKGNEAESFLILDRHFHDGPELAEVILNGHLVYCVRQVPDK